MSDPAEVVLTARGLTKHFPSRRGPGGMNAPIKAVDGVDFELHRGEALGLVGESGCGKSTLAKLLMGLEAPTSGSIQLLGREVVGVGRQAMKRNRRDMQMVFQDPYASLNPRMSVAQIIAEPLEIHRMTGRRAERRARVAELMHIVGLDPSWAHRRPSQLSGGQRQRVGIARALALEPQVLICDEPVSALDVSVQAQVINLLDDLKRQLEIAYLFIAHDLSVVKHISDRIAVMYLGRIVEEGDERDVFEHASHPYTQALLSAVPVPDPAARHMRNEILLPGDPPSPADPPSGCSFRTRCWVAAEQCAAERPNLEIRDGTNHPAACHFASPALPNRYNPVSPTLIGASR